jgi:hypothetical protein
MNAQNAHEYLPLVRALADGKTIQCRYQIEDDWYEESEINFNWPLESYRIKPESRTFEMWLASSGVMYPEKLFDNGKPYERITVQEVLK